MGRCPIFPRLCRWHRGLEQSFHVILLQIRPSKSWHCQPFCDSVMTTRYKNTFPTHPSFAYHHRVKSNLVWIKDSTTTHNVIGIRFLSHFKMLGTCSHATLKSSFIGIVADDNQELLLVGLPILKDTLDLCLYGDDGELTVIRHGL